MLNHCAAWGNGSVSREGSGAESGPHIGLDIRKRRIRIRTKVRTDRQTDPFSRGAYSYAKVGADGAQASVAAPVENTLFFAGEASDTSGNNGTVHGAIASGYRAAEEITKINRQ